MDKKIILKIISISQKCSFNIKKEYKYLKKIRGGYKRWKIFWKLFFKSNYKNKIDQKILKKNSKFFIKDVWKNSRENRGIFMLSCGRNTKDCGVAKNMSCHI